MVLIQISLSPVNGGHIKLNSIELTEFPFNGHYYKEIPITLSAIPANGFEFTGWSGVDNGDSSQITIMLIDDMSITAHFTPVDEGEIVINEINYNSSSDFDSEDWVEIFNGRHSDVDLSGWTFKDSEDDHQFILPNNIELNTGEYLILCRDTTAFMSLFPNQTNFIGNFNFGLSGSGELIRLFNQTGVLIDEVEYDDHSPWPEEADGNGPTLELINPNEDNELPINWSASNDYGSPGEINSSYLSAIEETVTPSAFKVYNNYPNPFNPSTILSFEIPENSFVTITIFDLLGREVRTLMDNYENTGFKSVIWNGTNNQGNPVGAGVYFYQVRAGNSMQSKKMLLLK